MPFPTYREIQLPLLAELRRRGGAARPSDKAKDGRDVYMVLADYFALSEADRRATIAEPGRAARVKWKNMVRWVRNDLRKIGLLSGTVHGVWSLTARGETLIAEVTAEEPQMGLMIGEARLTPAALETLQQRRRHIGQLGEEFVLELERRRLADAGATVLCAEVRHVAVADVSAGYDILSFELDGRPRFIEVKTTSSASAPCYLSANELKVARQFGSQYFLYRVSRIESEAPTLEVFPDLADELARGRFSLVPESYRLVRSESD